jgi:nucleoside-diphosphate-sugar epimerase
VHSVICEDLSSIIDVPLDWERFRSKTILVTGANGFLPAYMVETLLQLNTMLGIQCNVVCLVRNLAKAEARFQAYSGRSDLSFFIGDVSKDISISRRCDFIIHAASQASPKYFGCDPVGTMTSNLLGTYQLLERARMWNSEGFLFFSSGEVYGQVLSHNVPIQESDYGYIDILKPRSCYAEGKRAAETLIVSYVQQYQMPCVIVRPFHTYGPGMALDDGRVYADFVRDIVNRRDICLRSDGKAIRAFCYLSDAVSGFFTALLNGEPGQAYNVGNPNATISIANLADLLVGLFPNLHLKVNRTASHEVGYLASPIQMNSPNIERMAKLGWKPTHALEDGFIRTVRYFTES